MYRRILLAYDGSDEGRSALREGALLALRCGARVHLLCILLPEPGVRMAQGAYPTGLEEPAARYRSTFEEALFRLRDVGLRAEGRVVVGEPALEIAAYAKETRADLVVVGHRRMSLLERWWSGKMGAYLADHIRCSLLVARRVISDDDFQAELETAKNSRVFAPPI